MAAPRPCRDPDPSLTIGSALANEINEVDRAARCANPRMTTIACAMIFLKPKEIERCTHCCRCQLVAEVLQTEDLPDVSIRRA